MGLNYHAERAKRAAQIFSFENLLRRYYDCRKRKRFTINAAKFEINLEQELLKLKEELDSHVYTPGRSICFVVTKPKVREIFAADFRDRIVHHVLVNYFESIWEPKFIDQSYSCRKGKGAHKAIYDLKRYIGKVTEGGAEKAYYLKIDIQSFFVSLKKEILFEIIQRHTKNPEIIWLTKVIIFHNPTLDYHRKCQMSLFDLIPDHKSLFKVGAAQGLPIGNLTSQFFANVYLNELDQFVRHKLKAKYYLRYVDDMILLSKEKEQLEIWRDEIDAFLREKLGLKLHPKKEVLQEISRGIDFVGFVVKPDYTLMRKRIVKNLKKKLWRFNCKPEKLKEEGESEQVLPVVNSYYGQFSHAKTFGLRNKLWQKNFGELRKFLEPVDKNFSHFKMRE